MTEIVTQFMNLMVVRQITSFRAGKESSVSEGSIDSAETRGAHEKRRNSIRNCSMSVKSVKFQD